MMTHSALHRFLSNQLLSRMRMSPSTDKQTVFLFIYLFFSRKCTIKMMIHEYFTEQNSCVQVFQRLIVLFILSFSVITVKKRRCITAAGTRRTAPSNASRNTGTPITNVPAAGRDELQLATSLLLTPPIHEQLTTLPLPVDS